VSLKLPLDSYPQFRDLTVRRPARCGTSRVKTLSDCPIALPPLFDRAARARDSLASWSTDGKFAMFIGFPLSAPSAVCRPVRVKLSLVLLIACPYVRRPHRATAQKEAAEKKAAPHIMHSDRSCALEPKSSA
jgi:hypothetical protein